MCKDNIYTENVKYFESKIAQEGMQQPRSSMISVRGGFSDENNMGSVTNAIQRDELDNRTRVILSNRLRKLLEFLFEKDIGQQYFSDQYFLPNKFCQSILSDVFIVPINLSERRTYDWRSIYDNKIVAVFLQAPYNEVLDIIWYSCDWFIQKNSKIQELLAGYFNYIFEKECVGYRFVDRKIVEITDDTEIQAIEQAASGPFEACRSHIAKAVGFLADREKKDYKNCVKESISAVEAICKIISDEPDHDLSKAIKHLKKGGVNIHPTLESAWVKIYSYTCDEGGIRHSEKLFESDVTFEQAKLMLVSCSAFVNYLIAEYGKIKGKL